MSIQNINVLWDDNPVDITSEANFIWSIANKLRGVYMPDKYGDVIIPMTIIRRLECALEPTKKAVVAQFEKNPASSGWCPFTTFHSADSFCAESGGRGYILLQKTS